MNVTTRAGPPRPCTQGRGVRGEGFFGLPVGVGWGRHSCLPDERADKNVGPTQTRRQDHSARIARLAFTLVEVMVAVLVLALLSASAALVFSQPLNAARFADACRAVRAFDRATRQASVVGGKPVRLVVDFANRTLTRCEGLNLTTTTARLALPAGVRVAEVRVGGQSVATGEADLDVSPLGLSRTYALRLTGAAGTEQWLLIAGLTGDVTPVQNERTLDAIDRAENSTSARHDAD